VTVPKQKHEVFSNSSFLDDGGEIKVKKILWVSPFAPYDRVPHAGGKAENYFLKGVHSSKRFHLDVITCYRHREKADLDLDEYGIPNRQMDLEPNKAMLVLKKLANAESALNPWNRNGCILQNRTEYLLKKALKKYLPQNGRPDIVVLEWTETVLLHKYIKKLFPDAKILAIEEDVSFLGYQRRFEKAGNAFSKWVLGRKYRTLKRIETEALRHADKIMVYSHKDAGLLLEQHIPGKKIFEASTYFDDFSKCRYRSQNKDIIFYGAMSRFENYLSAIWFIENVLPMIKDKECRFIVIGANPPERLLQYRSERVQVLGFVEDVSEYFEASLCLAAPLLLGAGIKVKILEAMSAGLPILTNDIGIEGIPAKTNKEYLHCETPEDYAGGIEKLLSDRSFADEMAKNSKELLAKNFNKKESLEKLIFELGNMCSRRERGRMSDG
jgi:Glycosyltransferase